MAGGATIGQIQDAAAAALEEKEGLSDPMPGDGQTAGAPPIAAAVPWYQHLPGFLKAKIPAGESPEQYDAHVLNPGHLKSLSKVLQATTAMFGDSNYAVVQLAIGLVEIPGEMIARRAGGAGGGGVSA